jgi:hypothetical protein
MQNSNKQTFVVNACCITTHMVVVFVMVQQLEDLGLRQNCRRRMPEICSRMTARDVDGDSM